MDAHWWIQQVTTSVGAVTCWIQQPVSSKQVAGFTCVFNSEVDQLIRKLIVQQYCNLVLRLDGEQLLKHHCLDCESIKPILPAVAVDPKKFWKRTDVHHKRTAWFMSILKPDSGHTVGWLA